MKEFEPAKKKYEQIEIPEELNTIVQDTISQSAKRKNRKSYIYKTIIGTAAALLIAVTALLNTSESFAKEMQEIPIFSMIAKVLTIRSYDKTDDTANIQVKVPAILEETTSTEYAVPESEAEINAITDINAEIDRICEEYVKGAEARAAEYKKAFLETGGTEEEWKNHNIEIKVDYEVKSQTTDYLSFLVYGTESWTGAYAETYYYNMNLKTGEPLSLQDLLGTDYVAIANESILSQMKEREEQDEYLEYWGEDMDGFTSISDQTNFYVNENGNPVIVFAKYEIAPGAYGVQEFEIIKQ